jgi:hypothetical protein
MRRWFSIVAAALLALILCAPAPAQELAKRLILKDGSYQAVTKWELKGDRVRYYSAERTEWEEMPKSLVDWDATNKYNQARESGAPPPEIQQQVDKELEADTADSAPTPQAAPGLNLPDFEGVFVLDAYQGQPQLLEMQQTAGDLNRNLKRNILTATINPLSAGKQLIELPGGHAAIQVHTPRPGFFINSSDLQPADKAQAAPATASAEPSKSSGKSPAPKEAQPPTPTVAQYRLVRLQPKNGKRILGDLKIAVYGKVTQEQKFVPSTAERMTGNWVKITPTADLQPGEYAVVEMLSPKEMNLEVWDFGVNPTAPANPGAWKPAAPKPAGNQPPLLQSRPKSQ